MKPGARWLVNIWGYAKAERARLAYALTFAADRPEARAVLRDLAVYCNVAQTSFVPNDPHATAFNEGRRDAFNHVVEMLGLAPADVVALIQEPQP
jgi:hypothetical protein